MIPTSSDRHTDAQNVYAAAMNAAVQVMELTRIMRKKAMKRVAEPVVRSSNAVCANFLAAWQGRSDPEVYRTKLTAALADATRTRDELKNAADSNLMPVERTRAVVQLYDELIDRLTGMLKQNSD
jgi:four helix bundle protein